MLSAPPTRCGSDCFGPIFLPGMFAAGIASSLAAPFGAWLSHALPPKQAFRDGAFTVIRTYFEEAATEISEVEDIKSRLLMGNHGFACTVVNRARSSGVANITVYSNAGRYSLRDISYAFQERAEPNTANGWFQIEADGR